MSLRRRYEKYRLLSLWGVAALLGGVLGQTSTTLAESPQLNLLKMQKAPSVLKLQAQVSQGKLPIGDGKFKMVYVNAVSGATKVSLKSLPDVVIRDGVINLDIYAPALEQLIATNPALSIELCIEQPDNCLTQIPISSVPYAIKSSYAHTARNAAQATSSAECDYTHRATGDAVTWSGTEGTGVGYLDFETPVTVTNGAGGAKTVALDMAKLALTVNPTTSSAGVIAWRPASGASKELHLCGVDSTSGSRVPLDQLLLQAQSTTVTGSLKVGLDATINGAATITGGATLGAVPNASVQQPTTNIYTPTNFGNTDMAAQQPPVNFYGTAYFDKGFACAAGTPCGGSAAPTYSVLAPLSMDASQQISISPCANGQVLSYVTTSTPPRWTCTTPATYNYTGTAPIAVNASTKTVSLKSCAANQQLVYDGTSWVCSGDHIPLFTRVKATDSDTGTATQLSVSAVCPTGYEVLGGGCNTMYYDNSTKPGTTGNTKWAITDNYPYGNGWYCRALPMYTPPTAAVVGYGYSLEAHVICGDVQ